MQTNSKETDVKALFSDIARKYDLGNQLISFGLHNRFKRKALLELNLKPGHKLLDLCTGTGDMSFLAYQMFPGITVCGIDFSEKMIEVARERLHNMLLAKSKIEFLVADATNLPFSDESFDSAVTAFGLRNIGDKKSYFKEACRVLKPGGKLVVLEFSHPDDSLFKTAYKFYLKYLVPFLGYVSSGNFQAYKYLTDSIFNYSRISEIKKLAEEAGFTFKFKKFLFGFLSLYICTKKNA